MDEVAAWRLVQQARVARLATVVEAGRPHLVPIVFAIHQEAIVTPIDRKPKRTTALRRLANIRSNPNVAMLVDHFEDDWSRLWWVRVGGRAEIPDGADRESRLASLVAKYPQYRVQPPDGPVIEIAVDRFRYWSARD